jgi:hypothetical protein
MINLIPPGGHRAVRKEYVMRVGATYCFLFAAVAILLTIALVPTYVLVRAQMRGFSTHGVVQETATDLKSIEADVTRIEAILAELRRHPETTPMTSILRAIEDAASSGITFRNFVLGHTKGTLNPIQVQGVASRREDLVALKQALEQHALFESATVPLGDLAREREVPFSLTITLAKEQ